MAKNKKKSEDVETNAKEKSTKKQDKSTTKSSAKEKTSATNKKVESKETQSEKASTKQAKSSKKSKKPNYWLLGLIVVVGLVVIALLALRKELFVATVNGKPVTRWELVRELEKQGGEQVLQSLVIQKLIDQEAAKNSITVTEQDLDNEVEKIRGTLPQGLSLEDALASQGQTIEGLRKQLVIQVKVNKLVEDRVQVTEDEVNQYFEENRDFLLPEGSEQSEEEVKNQIREDLKQQKIQFEIGNFVEELKNNAIINYYKFVVITPQEAPQGEPAQE